MMSVVSNRIDGDSYLHGVAWRHVIEKIFKFEYNYKDKYDLTSEKMGCQNTHTKKSGAREMTWWAAKSNILFLQRS